MDFYKNDIDYFIFYSKDRFDGLIEAESGVNLFMKGWTFINEIFFWKKIANRNMFIWCSY